MTFLRAVYQGAIAAGWEPMDQGGIQGLPPQSLSFRRPGAKKGVVFARPEYSMSPPDMLATSLWFIPQGLRMLWLSPELPMREHRDAPFVFLLNDSHVQPPKCMEMVPVAAFVELALQGWFRFSDERGRWVWSNPKTDPEAMERQKFRDAQSRRAAQKDADMLRGR